MAKHKAGPWAVIPGRAEYREMSRVVAGPGREEHIIGYVLREHMNKHQQAEDDANARLIAAAPELLAALEALVNFTKGHEDWPEVRRAEVAIRKAKGDE